MRLVGVLLLIALVDTKKVVPRPRRYLTIKGSKCPCWWDLEGKLIDPKTNKPYKCTCCKEGGIQCGYPMHRWCTDDRSKVRTGCMGIKQRKYTISEIGHPCHFDRSRNDCAWCTPDSFQCGPDSKNGKYCMDMMRNHRHCRGETLDCRVKPGICGSNASCKNTKLRAKGKWFFHTCVCNEGYIGNGVTCIEAGTGVLSREKIEVEVNLTMTLDKSFAPATYPTIDFGNSTTLHETMLKTESNATNCESCNVSFMECGKET